MRFSALVALHFTGSVLAFWPGISAHAPTPLARACIVLQFGSREVHSAEARRAARAAKTQGVIPSGDAVIKQAQESLAPNVDVVAEQEKEILHSPGKAAVLSTAAPAIVNAAVDAAAVAAQEVLRRGGGRVTRATIEDICAAFSKRMMEEELPPPRSGMIGHAPPQPSPLPPLSPPPLPPPPPPSPKPPEPSPPPPKAAPAPDATAAPSQPAKHPTASMQFMVTKAMEAQLHKLGYDGREINRMLPTQAAAIIANRVRAAEAQMPDATSEAQVSDATSEAQVSDATSEAQVSDAVLSEPPPRRAISQERLTEVLIEFVEAEFAMRLCDELRVQPLIGAPRHTRIGIVFRSVRIADTTGTPKLDVELNQAFEQRSGRLLEHLAAHLRTSLPELERLQYDAKSPPSTRIIVLANQSSRRRL